MLDIKFIREHPDLINQAARDKKINFQVEPLLELDQKIRPLQQEVEQLRQQRNELSKKVSKLTAEERQEVIKQVTALKSQLEQAEKQLSEWKEEFDQLMLLVPQPARSDVPVGKDDQDNVEIRRWGDIPQFKFKPRSHEELGRMHDIIDFERGVKLAGSRSYILKGDGALLEQAVMRYTYDKLVGKGYCPMSIPVLVSEQCMEGTGYFPTGRDQAYYIEKDQLALVGTAEVSLTSYYSNEILEESQLPVRMMAQSSCFRREAGSYGRDTHGLYRVHQFQKIEQVIVAPADESLSEQLHEELLANAEEILQDFGLPYRVVYVCTGDLGQGQVRKHDIETWMPSRGSYGETHSCSSFHDFQARRLKMRYRNHNNETTFCYTLNNTAIASPRILIALLENFQQEDGSILIPKALQPFLGKEKIACNY